MTTGLPLAEAAQALGVRQGTLRRWIRQGCPVASRGRRGRGHAVLLDPAAVRQWREAGERERIFLELAAAVPHVLAHAAAKSFRLAEGLDKRRLAGALAATWYVSASAVLDHLRQQCPAVPEVADVPEEIASLRKIAR